MDLAGKVWISTSGPPSGFEVHWVIEGAAVQITNFWCLRNMPCQQRIALLTLLPDQRAALSLGIHIEYSDRAAGDGFVDGDELYIRFSAFNTARYKFDARTGMGFFGGVDYRLAAADDLKDAAAKGVDLQAHRAERERLAAEKRQEDAARAEADRARQIAMRAMPPMASKTRKGNGAEAGPAAGTGSSSTAPARDGSQVAPVAGNGKPGVVAAQSTAPGKAPSLAVAAPGRGGGAPLTFIVYQALQPGMKARRNGHCYSNVITVPGPPGFQTGKGWGGSETGAVDKAITMVKAYFEEFRQKCNQSVDGQRHMRVEGTTLYDFNTLAEPDRVQRAYSRFKSFGGDMVEVQLAPR